MLTIMRKSKNREPRTGVRCGKEKARTIGLVLYARRRVRDRFGAVRRSL